MIIVRLRFVYRQFTIAGLSWSITLWQCNCHAYDGCMGFLICANSRRKFPLSNSSFHSLINRTITRGLFYKDIFNLALFVN